MKVFNELFITQKTIYKSSKTPEAELSKLFAYHDEKHPSGNPSGYVLQFGWASQASL